MDIVISSEDKIVIIENKIYAGDQPRQLVRYKSYAAANFAMNKLCYLTLDGHDADKTSSGKLKSGTDYITLSYRNDILKWLNDCIMSAVQRPLIRETIIQYKKTIEQLTNQQMEQEEKRSLYELMISHAAEIDAIVDNDLACRRYVIENKIIPELKSLGVELNLNFMLGKSFLDGKKNVGFAFTRTDWKNIIQFEFGGSGWTKLFYGVYSTDTTESTERLPGFKKPFGYFIYGWRWINPGNWKYTELSGDVIIMSIRETLRDIISILDKDPDRFPM